MARAKVLLGVITAFFVVTCLFSASVTFAVTTAQQLIQQYTAEIQRNPNNVDAYFHRGCYYSSLKQYERAIQDFDKAIQLSPNNAGYYSTRGLSYYRLKQYQRAIQDFNKSLEINPNNYI